MDIMYNEPNEETQAAIKEARSGKNLKEEDKTKEYHIKGAIHRK